MELLKSYSFKNITICPVDEEFAGELLGKEDDYLKNLSCFDLQSRLQCEKTDLKVEDYVCFLTKQVLKWEEQYLNLLLSKAQIASDLFEGYNIKFPSRIYIVLTNGKDEQRAAYCRGLDVIVIPTNFFNDYFFLKVFIHECFHIFSRNNLELKDKLYEVIGFRRLQKEVKLPECLIRISNPGKLLLIRYKIRLSVL